MDIRDAVEADAERLAELTDSPEDVMRNLVHDRTVRVGEADGDILGFVSYDAQAGTVHVTQLEGDIDSCVELLAEPIRFAESEGMPVELLVPEDDGTARDAAERVGFDHTGAGPRFDGRETVRYRYE